MATASVMSVEFESSASAASRQAGFLGPREREARGGAGAGGGPEGPDRVGDAHGAARVGVASLDLRSGAAAGGGGAGLRGVGARAAAVLRGDHVAVLLVVVEAGVAVGVL